MVLPITPPGPLCFKTCVGGFKNKDWAWLLPGANSPFEGSQGLDDLTPLPVCLVVLPSPPPCKVPG